MIIRNDSVDTQNSSDKIAAKYFQIIWWLIWLAAVFLLEFHFRGLNGERLKIPYGQYLFFVLALATGLAVYFFCKNHILRNINRELIIAFIVLIMILACSSSSGINAIYGLRLLLILTITGIPFVLLGMVSVCVQGEGKVSPILGVSIGIAVASCLLSLSGPLSFFGITIENFMMGERWAFLFIEANGLGGMMAVGLTGMFYYFCMSQKLAQKLLLSCIFLPIILLVVWQTNSRGTLLWVVVTGVLYAGFFILKSELIHSGRKTRKWMVLILVLSVIITVLIWLKFWPQLNAFLRMNQSDLTTGRMEVWLLYLAQFKTHPLLGFGFGASELFMADFVSSGPYRIAGPLNVFIGMLGETGLLGMVAMLYLWVGAILKSWRVIRQRAAFQDSDFHYAFFLLVMLVSLAAQQNGEWLVMRVTPINYLFFFLISAAWTLEKKVSLLQNKKPSMTVQ